MLSGKRRPAARKALQASPEKQVLQTTHLRSQAIASAAGLPQGTDLEARLNLAIDTGDVPDVRRWPTRELRAEGDRLAQLRAECPPDRSPELRLAAQRSADADQARQQARADHQAAAEQVDALQGRCCAAATCRPPGTG
jgi:hypothetical protein